MALDLPDFPWDQLVPFKQRAAEHEGGIVDLSVGSPGGAAAHGVVDKDHPFIAALPPQNADD